MNSDDFFNVVNVMEEVESEIEEAEKHALWSLGISSTSLVFSIFVFILMLALTG